MDNKPQNNAATPQQLRVIMGDLTLHVLSMFSVMSDDISDIHYHSCLELQYITDGVIAFSVNGVTLTASAGDLILIPAHILHRNVHIDNAH